MRERLLVCAALLVLTPAGCRSAPVSRPAVSSVPSETVRARVLDTAPVSWRFREYELAGSWKVNGHYRRIALLVHDLRDEAATRELHLMDLGSGRRGVVRERSVNKGLVISGAKLGEGWVAWEEVPPNDLERDPKTVVWSVYAARFETATLSVKEPRLIVTGTLDQRSRPLFGLDGRVLFVATNSRSSNGTTESVVDAFDLEAGSRRTLAAAATFVTSMGVSDGSVVVVTRRDAGGGDVSSRIDVLDSRTGRKRLSYDPQVGRVAHPASFHDGWLAWASLPPGEAATTEVYVRSPDGRVKATTMSGNDAGIVGGYAIAEGSEPNTESVGTKSFAPGAQVFVMPLGGDRRSRLVEGQIERGYWWQVAAPAEYRSNLLVVYANGTLLGARTTTTVRAYEVPPVRTSASSAVSR